MSDTDKPKNRVIRFLCNPLVGGLGTIIAIISLGAALYFYLEQRQSRGLIYYVHPVKAAVVARGAQVSKLTAYYGEKRVITDITVAQVAIWNQGKLPIKDADILQPIVLFTADKTPILEATTRKVSREVSKLRLNADEAPNGRVTISWKILEQNDGGVIQLIYAGNPNVDIRLDGVIEGQKEIARVVYSERIMSPDQQLKEWEAIESISYVMVLVGAGALSFLFIISFVSSSKKRTFFPGANPATMLYFMWISAVAVMITGIIMFLTQRAPTGPPFGF